MPSREPEIYKDKIEVSLDGRQIFYLFFGGAVIVGLVFVLGVMVGRRVEARGHLDRAQTQTARDPLAALDRLEHSDNLSFHGALTGSEAPTDVEKAIGEIDRHRSGGKPEAKPDKPEPRTDVKAEAKPESRADKAEAKPEAKADKAEAKTEAKPDKTEAKADKAEDRARGDKAEDRARGDKHDGDKHDGDKHAKKHDDGESRDAKHVDKDKADKRADARAERSDDARSTDKPSDKSGDKSSDKPGDKVADKSGDKGRFTLQLSSFQDKSEAESFLSSIKSAGYQAYLTEADVGSKGTFYRVRLGSFRSIDAASDAKAEYEKAAKKSAQVMKL